MDRNVKTATRNELLNRDFMDDLGEWLRREPGSREDLINNGTAALYAFHKWGGRLLTGEGEPIPIVAGLFDNVHSECSDGEWISEQRRREKALRAPRKCLLSRLQVYDALGRLCGRPVGNAARREEVARMRKLLRALTPTVRTFYLAEVRKLRVNAELRDLRYGAAVRRLRIECGEQSEAELRARAGRPRCPDCGRVRLRWSEELAPACRTCGNPNVLPARK